MIDHQHWPTDHRMFRVIEDAPADSEGNSSFTILWWDKASGQKRGQCFHGNREHIAAGMRDEGFLDYNSTAEAEALDAKHHAMVHGLQDETAG